VRPIIISIPHASLQIPEGLEGNVLLSEQDLLGYSDLYSDRIFAVPDTYVVQANVSRVFVDVNRRIDKSERTTFSCVPALYADAHPYTFQSVIPISHSIDQLLQALFCDAILHATFYEEE